MLTVIAALILAVITLTVFLILDSTGVLYKGKSNTADKSNSVTDGSFVLQDAKDIRTSGDYQYRLHTDGTAELYFYTQNHASSVTVPAEIDGHKVTVIGECFVWMYSLTEVVIPDGVVVIGSSAFEGCSYLNSVTLPKSLKVIEDNAFLNCPSAMNIAFSGDPSELRIGNGNTTFKLAIGAK